MVDKGEGIRKGSKMCVDIVSLFVMSLRKVTDKEANSGLVAALECKSCIMVSRRQPASMVLRKLEINAFVDGVLRQSIAFAFPCSLHDRELGIFKKGTCLALCIFVLC